MISKEEPTKRHIDSYYSFEHIFQRYIKRGKSGSISAIVLNWTQYRKKSTA